MKLVPIRTKKFLLDRENTRNSGQHEQPTDKQEDRQQEDRTERQTNKKTYLSVYLSVMFVRQWLLFFYPIQQNAECRMHICLCTTWSLSISPKMKTN